MTGRDWFRWKIDSCKWRSPSMKNAKSIKAPFFSVFAVSLSLVSVLFRTVDRAEVIYGMLRLGRQGEWIKWAVAAGASRKLRQRQRGVVHREREGVGNSVRAVVSDCNVAPYTARHFTLFLAPLKLSFYSSGAPLLLVFAKFRRTEFLFLRVSDECIGNGVC